MLYLLLVDRALGCWAPRSAYPMKTWTRDRTFTNYPGLDHSDSSHWWRRLERLDAYRMPWPRSPLRYLRQMETQQLHQIPEGVRILHGLRTWPGDFVETLFCHVVSFLFLGLFKAKGDFYFPTGRSLIWGRYRESWIGFSSGRPSNPSFCGSVPAFLLPIHIFIYIYIISIYL